MPVTTEKRKGKWRVVEKATGHIAKNQAGKSLDGGGHASEAAAKKQAQAVNVSTYGKPKKAKHGYTLE